MKKAYWVGIVNIKNHKSSDFRYENFKRSIDV